MTPRIETEALQAIGVNVTSAPDEAVIRMTAGPTPAVIRAPVYAQLGQANLIIDHLNDLVTHFAAQAEHWRACAVGHLPQITGLKAEIKRLEAEIERQREYIAGRVYDC